MQPAKITVDNSDRTTIFFLSRYIAVHNPLDYNLAMNDADAIKTRLAKYLLPVVVSAVIFNIPKFFESTVDYVEVGQRSPQARAPRLQCGNF